MIGSSSDCIKSVGGMMSPMVYVVIYYIVFEVCYGDMSLRNPGKSTVKCLI